MKTLLLALVVGASLAGCAVYPANGYGYGYPAASYPAYGSVNVYGSYGYRDGGHRYYRDRDGRYYDGRR